MSPPSGGPGRHLRAGGLPTCVRTDQRPNGVTGYARIGGTPQVLAALLAVLGLAVLGQLIVASGRRRRRDFAILKTLGLVRRQVSAITAWQVSTPAGLALVAGVPLGVAAGRWAWALFARGLGISTIAITPVPLVLVTVPAVIVAANAVAFWPGRTAARLSRPRCCGRNEEPTERRVKISMAGWGCLCPPSGSPLPQRHRRGSSPLAGGPDAGPRTPAPLAGCQHHRSAAAQPDPHRAVSTLIPSPAPSLPLGPQCRRPGGEIMRRHGPVLGPAFTADSIWRPPGLTRVIICSVAMPAVADKQVSSIVPVKGRRQQPGHRARAGAAPGSAQGPSHHHRRSPAHEVGAAVAKEPSAGRCCQPRPPRWMCLNPGRCLHAGARGTAPAKRTGRTGWPLPTPPGTR